MRVMAIIKSTEESERDTMSDPTFHARMGAYNKELQTAGVTTGGEGLRSSMARRQLCGAPCFTTALRSVK